MQSSDELCNNHRSKVSANTKVPHRKCKYVRKGSNKCNDHSISSKCL